MKINPIKTKIIKPNDNIYWILDQFLPEIKERSVLAITSKIISFCEGSLVLADQKRKEGLISEHADWFLPK